VPLDNVAGVLSYEHDADVVEELRRRVLVGA
jgi:hypothetical protein